MTTPHSHRDQDTADLSRDWTGTPATADGRNTPLPIYPQPEDLPRTSRSHLTAAELVFLDDVLARGIPDYDQEPTMSNTDHQLAKGVCESIATTTPRFRPPSRSSGFMREAIGWTLVAGFLLLIVALASAIGG